jgi:hypothetical protein
LIIKYATPPKIANSHEDAGRSSSRGSESPHVGEIPSPQLESELIPPMLTIPMRNPNPIVTVTISGVPPSLDLMTFNFLSNYGRVIEGKVFQDPHAMFQNASQPNSTQSYHGVIRFSILADNTQSIANLLALEGSVAVVSGYPVVVSHFHSFSLIVSSVNDFPCVTHCFIIVVSISSSTPMYFSNYNNSVSLLN